MGFARGDRAVDLRWSVEIPTLSVRGASGAQTFIVRAATCAEAIDAAWEEAQSPEATRRRNGAALGVQRSDLYASVIRGCLC